MWIEKKSHYNSRVSLHEAPTKNEFHEILAEGRQIPFSNYKDFFFFSQKVETFKVRAWLRGRL